MRLGQSTFERKEVSWPDPGSQRGSSQKKQQREGDSLLTSFIGRSVRGDAVGQPSRGDDPDIFQLTSAERG